MKSGSYFSVARKLSNPEILLGGKMDVRTKSSNTTFIELAVDGQIVDEPFKDSASK